MTTDHTDAIQAARELAHLLRARLDENALHPRPDLLRKSAGAIRDLCDRLEACERKKEIARVTKEAHQ